jgi:hypothetical protein
VLKAIACLSKRLILALRSLEPLANPRSFGCPMVFESWSDAGVKQLQALDSRMHGVGDAGR